MTKKERTKAERTKKTAQSVNAKRQMYEDGIAKRDAEHRARRELTNGHPRIAGGEKEIAEYLARNPVRNW